MLYCKVFAAYAHFILATPFLLPRAKASPDKLNLKGRTPLLIAAWNGHSDAIAELLKHKVCNQAF